MTAATPTAAQLNDLINSIHNFVSQSQRRRLDLSRAKKIPNIYYPLISRSTLEQYLADLTGKAKVSQPDIMNAVKDLLATSPTSPPTVSWLENELLDYAALLTPPLVTAIIGSISGYQNTIDRSTAKLNSAFSKIQDMNEAFGAIVLFVNLIAAMIKTSSGNFDALAKVIAELP